MAVQAASLLHGILLGIHCGVQRRYTYIKDGFETSDIIRDFGYKSVLELFLGLRTNETETCRCEIMWNSVAPLSVSNVETLIPFR